MRTQPIVFVGLLMVLVVLPLNVEEGGSHA